MITAYTNILQEVLVIRHDDYFGAQAMEPGQFTHDDTKYRLMEVREALPAGWEEQRSHTTGEVYWYNTLTGLSTWERPMALASTAESARSSPPAPAAAPPAVARMRN